MGAVVSGPTMEVTESGVFGDGAHVVAMSAVEPRAVTLTVRS